MNDSSYQMPDLFLNGCNLSDTLVFLPKLSTKTLNEVFWGLVLDLESGVYPRMKKAIFWHMVTIRSILEGRKVQ